MSNINNVPLEVLIFLRRRKDELGLTRLWDVVMYYLWDSGFKKEFSEWLILKGVHPEEIEHIARDDDKRRRDKKAYSIQNQELS